MNAAYLVGICLAATLGQLAEAKDPLVKRALAFEAQFYRIQLRSF